MEVRFRVTLDEDISDEKDKNLLTEKLSDQFYKGEVTDIDSEGEDIVVSMKLEEERFYLDEHYINDLEDHERIDSVEEANVMR